MHFCFFLYGGPDQLMPLTSGLAAVFAFLLIFWNKVLVTIGKIGRLLRQSNHNPDAVATKAEEPSDSVAGN